MLELLYLQRLFVGLKGRIYRPLTPSTLRPFDLFQTMLDLNHPHTRYVFAASGADDALLNLAKAITLELREGRITLLQKCDPYFEMLVANAGHMERGAEFEPVVADFRASMKKLAELNVVLDAPARESGEPCPVCEDVTAAIPGTAENYCATCIDVISKSRARVDRFFGFWAI